MLGLVVDVVDVVEAGFSAVCCASPSVMLISEFRVVDVCGIWLCDASVVLSICGCPPAIDVSGIPALRGGGGCEGMSWTL